ncbi:hypothetical protein [Micromonospora sp. NPDC023644]|uniref:hypothetical protein n=1 Tax=Micromonospora sp. NPDC023644 TaxID=3154321 RepID=UPI0033DE2866
MTTEATLTLLSRLTGVTVSTDGVAPRPQDLEVWVDVIRAARHVARCAAAVGPGSAHDQLRLVAEQSGAAGPGDLPVPEAVAAGGWTAVTRVRRLWCVARAAAALLRSASPAPRWQLCAALVAAGDDVEEVAGQLGQLSGLAAADRLAAEHDSVVWRLGSPEPAVADRTMRRVGVSLRSPLLLRALAAAVASATDPVVVERLARAHHVLGRATLVTTSERAVNPVRRSSYRGRYHQLDALVSDWFRLLDPATAALSRYRGVDLGAWRSACASGRLRIVDEAVADGLITVELAAAVAAAVGDRDVEVHGRDLNMDFYEVWLDPETVAVVDANGATVWLWADGVQLDPAAPESAARREAARNRFAGWGPNQRAQAGFRWLDPTPPPAGIARVDLRFDSHDVFASDPRPAHLIRVAGLLYRRLRPDVDADSYFTDEAITHALANLGRGLVEGGLLLVASVVDRRDGTRLYHDSDVYQRGPDELVRVQRIGLGLGPTMPTTVRLGR